MAAHWSTQPPAGDAKIGSGSTPAASIIDPHATENDPATYHMYTVSAWDGGEPTLFGDEHTELQWFPPAAAIALPDLALEGYRPLLRRLADVRRRH
jgi:hypothetical protein